MNEVGGEGKAYVVYWKLLPVQFLMKLRNITINNNQDSHPLARKLNQKHIKRRKPDFGYVRHPQVEHTLSITPY
jgi:hypothetical protein